MVIGVQQLREELYQIAQEKLVLEEKIKSIVPFMAALKRELDKRSPAIK